MRAEERANQHQRPLESADAWKGNDGRGHEAITEVAHGRSPLRTLTGNAR